MEQYDITGMSCAACAARIEKAVNNLPGVTACSVSLLTNSMGVEGTAGPEEVIKAVTDSGYGASLRNDAAKGSGMSLSDRYAAEEEALKDKESPVLLKRLLLSLFFLLILMYFSMGHMMFGFPVPKLFVGNSLAIAILEMLLALIVMAINGKFFSNGFRAALSGAPNMDTLVALGSGVSFLYSLCNLFLMTEVAGLWDQEPVNRYMGQMYFESAAMIVTLITVGKYLEAKSKGRTTDALRGLLKLSPKTAVVIRDGVETEVPADSLSVGDIFVVKAGSLIPADGVVEEGNAAVNEASLTGESVPVDKGPGDPVSSATMNESGFLKCRATRVGNDTTLANIIKMVSEAAATKAPIARTADRIAGVFVPGVLAIALITFAAWMLAGEGTGFALSRAISVLVISCPCALGLATPVAIMVGSGVGAKNGILFRTAASLEMAGRIDTVVLDKTGTVTKGEPAVTDIITASGVTEEELLKYAMSLEKMSEHSFGTAIAREAEARQIAGYEATGFEAYYGRGLRADVMGKEVKGGSLSYMKGETEVNKDLAERAGELSEKGKTPLLFSLDGELLGIIAVADEIREGMAEALGELEGMGIKTVMLTGDNEKTARAIAEAAGITEVVAGVLPDGKERVIRELMESGKTAMIGDGINDAPALTRADLGIAVGAGTDVAMEAADIVLEKSSPRDIPAVFRLGRKTLRNVHENLFWAFFYNIICIPLAAGVYYRSFGLSLSPMVGAAAMSLSSFCVVMNALRLNLFDIYDPRRDRRKAHAARDKGKNPESPEGNDDKENAEKEDAKMTVGIKGMMCEHCEATVKKVLEAIPEVSEAVVSREKGNAVLTLSGDPGEETVKKAVTDAGYEVTSVER